MYAQHEALAEQWNDVISVAEFVSDELTDQAKNEGDQGRIKLLLDGVRDIQSTIRHAQKVKQTLDWPE